MRCFYLCCMRRWLSIICLILAGAIWQGHEAWLQPTAYRLLPSDTLHLELLVGEGFRGETRAFEASKTVHFKAKGIRSVGAPRTEALQAPETPAQRFSLPLVGWQGTLCVFSQSTNSFIELAAEDFREYLLHDGLEHMDSLRTAQGVADRPARELYARYRKTLVRVGAGAPLAEAIARPLAPDGYEVVPLDDPYAHRAGDALRFAIYFKGKPQPNAMVQFWHRSGETLTKAQLRTDAQGVTSHRFELPGVWMVSSVWMIALADATEADYQSYWASLTFEVGP